MTDNRDKWKLGFMPASDTPLSRMMKGDDGEPHWEVLYIGAGESKSVQWPKRLPTKEPPA